MFFNKKKKIEEFRNQWGKPVERFRNMGLIAIYHQLMTSMIKSEYVDDKTWNDLNFDSFFDLVDRNISAVGQQYLYHKLHTFEKDENKLKKFSVLCEKFKRNQSLRESIRLAMMNLNDVSSYFIPNIILSKSLPFTKYYRLFYLGSILPYIAIILTFQYPFFFFITFLLFVINYVLNKVFAKPIQEYFAGFKGVNDLIVSAKKLANIKETGELQELKYIYQRKNILNKLGKKIGKLVVDKEAVNDVLLVGIEYLNILFLFDLIAYYKSVDTLQKFQKEMATIYEIIGMLDSAISIASYLEENNKYCTPIFTKEKRIEFENMYHPLITDAVSNSLLDLSKSALVTGSNMSGKTTFIKTIGINTILSQTLYFCHASRFVVPNYKVKSSIDRKEDLEHKKSYFFVEVEELKKFTELSENGNSYIFLVDEIFRGTNTVERLAASTAVLKYLNNHSIIFVTTHDVELQDLLQNEFEMLHFSEKVENGQYYFDYKIHKGPCRTRNAIKLLEIKNYPKSIIQEANSIAIKLTETKNEIL